MTGKFISIINQRHFDEYKDWSSATNPIQIRSIFALYYRFFASTNNHYVLNPMSRRTKP